MSDVPEMVERVRDILMEEDTVGHLTGARLEYERKARAVIAAMREPTEAMVDAGNANGLNYWRCDPPTADAEASWRAMIDEALSLKKVSV